jgi:hypothetical protein
VPTYRSRFARALPRQRLQIEEQVGSGVHDERRLGVAGVRVDAPEHNQPGRDAVEVADGDLQARQHGKRRRPSRRLRVLERDLARHLPERAKRRPVGSERAMPRHERPTATDANPPEWDRNARWELDLPGQLQSLFLKPLLHLSHASSSQ